MANNDGGQVFPHTQPGNQFEDAGMSLRDYFAAAAMQGLCVGCSGFLGNDFTPYAKGECNAEIAERAYVLADVMLAERVKDRQQDTANGPADAG